MRVDAVAPRLTFEHTTRLIEHMEGSERLLVLIERMRTTERVTVAELARDTGCSEMTIRRDLDQLAEQGCCAACGVAR